MSVAGRLVHHVTLGCSLPEARSGAKVATPTAAASYHHYTGGLHTQILVRRR